MFQTCLKCEIKIIFNIRSSSIPSPVNKAFRKDIYNYKRLIYNPYVNFTNLIAETYSQKDILLFYISPEQNHVDNSAYLRWRHRINRIRQNYSKDNAKTSNTKRQCNSMILQMETWRNTNATKNQLSLTNHQIKTEQQNGLHWDDQLPKWVEPNTDYTTPHEPVYEQTKITKITEKQL